jgi:hypothetical protein
MLANTKKGIRLIREGRANILPISKNNIRLYEIKI